MTQINCVGFRKYMREFLSFPDTQSFGAETGLKSEMGPGRVKTRLRIPKLLSTNSN
jgi:hypothetical protein